MLKTHLFISSSRALGKPSSPVHGTPHFIGLFYRAAGKPFETRKLSITPPGTGNSRPQRLLTFFYLLCLQIWSLFEWLVCLTRLCSNQSFMGSSWQRSPWVKGQRSSWFSNTYPLGKSGKVDNYPAISVGQRELLQRPNWKKMRMACAGRLSIFLAVPRPF